MTDMMMLTQLILGIFGLSAALYAIGITARRMRRRYHAVALHLMMVGVGLESIGMMFDHAGMLAWSSILLGEALIVFGAWAIILTRSADERRSAGIGEN